MPYSQRYLVLYSGTLLTKQMRYKQIIISLLYNKYLIYQTYNRLRKITISKIASKMTLIMLLRIYKLFN